MVDVMAVMMVAMRVNPMADTMVTMMADKKAVVKAWK
jgi:hypothetical protein